MSSMSETFRHRLGCNRALKHGRIEQTFCKFYYAIQLLSSFITTYLSDWPHFWKTCHALQSKVQRILNYDCKNLNAHEIILIQ